MVFFEGTLTSETITDLKYNNMKNKKPKTIFFAVFLSIFFVGMVKGFYKEYSKSEEASKKILAL